MEVHIKSEALNEMAMQCGILLSSERLKGLHLERMNPRQQRTVSILK